MQPALSGLPRPRPTASSGAASPGASQEEIRRKNLGALLRHVHVHGPTSRAELTSRLGLNRSTIGALAADLAAAGLVTEEAPTSARRAGRPSLVVSPRSRAVYARALSIEPDRLRTALVGLGGRILDLRETERPAGTSAADAVGPLAALVRDMEHHADPGAVCAGGAVAVSDTSRDSAGRIRIGGDDETLRAALDAEFPTGAPVASGEVADLAALAEHIRGVAAGVDDLVYLHGGPGVTAGIIIGGRLVTGHRGHSGRVGHMVVNPNGLPCECGTRGCWETEIGDAALLRHAGRQSAGPGAAGDVLADAANGEPVARAAVDHVADWLGFGVANLVNLLNPDTVVFGGSLRDIYTAGADTVRRRLDELALPASREHVQLRPAALGRNGALIGAAELAFDHLLADPLNVETAN